MDVSPNRSTEPLVLPFAFLACGVALARSVPFATSEAFVALSSVVILALLAQFLGLPRARRLGTITASGFAGVALVTLHPEPPAPRLSVPDGALATLGGCIVEPALVASERERFTLELDAGARAHVSLFVKDGVQFPDLPYGSNVEFVGKVRRPHNFGNPGSFDSVAYLARQQVYWNASGDAASLKLLPDRCGRPFLRFIYQVRSVALERLDRLYARDPYTDGMMRAVLVGETSRMEKIWTEDYRSTGTFHALVISGSHVAVLAGLLVAFLRLCAVPRAAALAAGVAVAWLYSGVAGWQAPVLRSAIGMTLFGFGRIFYREGRLLNILAAVAILFLLYDPVELFDASFQLSFLAVALIGAFAVPAMEATSGPISAGLRGLDDVRRDIRLPPRAAQFRVELRLLIETLCMLGMPPRVARWSLIAMTGSSVAIWDILVTTFFIQLGLALPMVQFFHRVSLSGLTANLLVGPLLSIVVPVGFLAIGLQSDVLARVCAALMDVSRKVVSFHASFEPDWRIPPPPFWLGVLLVFSLVAAALCARHVRHGRIGFVAGAMSWAMVAVSLSLVFVHPFDPDIPKGQLEVSAIDVGQGDSVLVAFPDGRLMLVDAGGIPTFGRARKSAMDIGEDVVSPYLWSRSIRRLDIVAMTHAHEDHMGGMAAVLRNFRPRELWTGANGASQEWSRVSKTAKALGIPVREMRRGEPFAYGGAAIRVLAPGPEYQASDKAKNDDSLVMRLSFGRTAFLLTGDMEKRTERELYFGGFLDPATVLKVGHHGSRTSSTPLLLDAVHPAFALVSDGFENSYGHPHPLTISALEQRHVSVYRTDQRGLVRVTSNGRRIQVE